MELLILFMNYWYKINDYPQSGFPASKGKNVYCELQRSIEALKEAKPWPGDFINELFHDHPLTQVALPAELSPCEFPLIRSEIPFRGQERIGKRSVGFEKLLKWSRGGAVSGLVHEKEEQYSTTGHGLNNRLDKPSGVRWNYNEPIRTFGLAN